MIDCYIYTRVSSRKQVKEGTGLDSQLVRCMNYARENQYKIIKTFKEKGVSGQLLIRPELEKLFLELEKNKNEKVLLVDSSSRLSRNLEHSLTYTTRLLKLKTKLVTADMTVPDGIIGDLVRNVMTAINQHEAQSNQLRVFHRMHACMQNKRYIFNPPFGYIRYVDPELGKTMRPDGLKSKIAKELLEKFATNQLETIADVQKQLLILLPAKNNNDTYRNKQAKRILSQSALYAGLIIYERKDEKLPEKKWSINNEGNHQPIISIETHKKIQEKLNKPRKVYKTKNIDKFPLRGNLKCNGCGGSMTANFSKSKSGKKIGYYRCNSYKCSYSKRNINKNLVEKAFLDYLSSISLNEKYLFVIKEVLEIVMNENIENSKYQKIQLNKKINETQDSIEVLIEKLTQDKFEKIHDEIAATISSKKTEILELKQSLNSVKNDTTLNKALPEIIAIFGDLSNHWLKSESYSKRNINNLVFPEGFSFTLDEKITTPKLSIPFNNLKENYESKSNLVEPRGIEPLTSTLPA